MSIVSLADVKAVGRIDYSDHDTQLQLLLDGAESFVSQYCCVSLGSQTITDERCDGGNENLWPAVLPIVSVTSVKDAWDDDAVVDATDYFATASAIVQDEEGFWSEGTLRYKVSYVGGYTANTIPAGMKNAIIGLALLAYENPQSKSQQGAAGYGAQWDKLADSSMLLILDQYSLRRYVE